MKKIITSFILSLAATLSYAQEHALIAIVEKAVKGRFSMMVEPGKYPVNTVLARDYEISIGQDVDTIPKSACQTVIWYAKDGHGYVTVNPSVKTRVNVRKSPSVNSPVIAWLKPDIEGYIPMDYPCLGKDDGWFKIEVGKGKTGFVLAKYLEWMINDADCAGCIR